MTVLLRLLALAAPVAACLLGAPAWSGDVDRQRRDHDIARQALERGEILPLEKVLGEVRKAAPGEVIQVELERKHGGWIYEIKVILPGGALVEVHADAGTARILKMKDK